jgi:hypothetical protein
LISTKKDEDVREAFEELCQKNARVTSPEIQHDMTQSFAQDVTEVIKAEIGDGLFSVLIDESYDVSIAEQIVVLVRLVVTSELYHFITYIVILFCTVINYGICHVLCRFVNKKERLWKDFLVLNMLMIQHQKH